jgi:hypothetical protein
MKLKIGHKNCCPDCIKRLKLPQDEELAPHYDVLIRHMTCLKSPSTRAKCQDKQEIISACEYIINLLLKKEEEKENVNTDDNGI